MKGCVGLCRKEALDVPEVGLCRKEVLDVPEVGLCRKEALDVPEVGLCRKEALDVPEVGLCRKEALDVPTVGFGGCGRCLFSLWVPSVFWPGGLWATGFLGFFWAFAYGTSLLFGLPLLVLWWKTIYMCALVSLFFLCIFWLFIAEAGCTDHCVEGQAVPGGTSQGHWCWIPSPPLG